MLESDEVAAEKVNAGRGLRGSCKLDRGSTNSSKDDFDDAATNARAEAAPADISTEVLEHAAARLVEGSPTYEQLRPGSGSHKRVSQAPPAPFGHDVLTDKTLDEVILAYLAQDLETGT